MGLKSQISGKAVASIDQADVQVRVFISYDPQCSPVHLVQSPRLGDGVGLGCTLPNELGRDTHCTVCGGRPRQRL